MAKITEFEETWIGKGMQFRNTFNTDTGQIISNASASRLHQSIFLILSTAIGERFLVPDFGSNLHKRVFEQNDYILRDLIQLDVKQALAKWEPRIEVISVEVQSESEGNTLPVNISYRIKSTNMIDNYVYPFKKNAQKLGDEIDYE